jgi:uncharacterized protein YjiS (DUF1127 family)
MAYATDIRIASGFNLVERFATLRASIADRLAKRAVYLRTLNELEALNERDLADLGIARSNIQAIATEAAYGK